MATFLDSIFGGKSPKFGKRPATSAEIEDVLRAAQKTADYNVGPGSEASAEIARQSNENVTRDLIEAMDKFFDGRSGEIQGNLAEGLAARSRGQVSPTTRRLLASQAAEKGAALGPQSAEDAFTVALGLTSEEVQSTATRDFQSLYGTYRQSLPLVSPAQVFDYGGVSNPTALQAALQGVGLTLQRDQFAWQAENIRSQQAGGFENAVGLGLSLYGAQSAGSGGFAGNIGGGVAQAFGGLGGSGSTGSLFGGGGGGGGGGGSGGGDSSSAIGSVVGGVAGAAIGSFVPGLGTAAGWAVGSAAGGAIGGAF